MEKITEKVLSILKEERGFLGGVLLFGLYFLRSSICSIL